MITTVACAGGCTVHGEHSTGCPGDDCRGCLPFYLQAVHGQPLVCPHCRDKAATQLGGLADLYIDLTERPKTSGLATYGGSTGDPEACPDCDHGQPCTRSHRSTPTPLGDRQMAARTYIRATLVAWTKHLHTAHGITVPDEARIAYVTRQIAHEASVQSAAHRLGASLASQPTWDPSLGRDVLAPRGVAEMHKAEEHRLRARADQAREDRLTGRDIIAALAEHLARHLDTILATDQAGPLLTDLREATREGRRNANPARSRRGLIICTTCQSTIRVNPTHWENHQTEQITCQGCGQAGVLDDFVDGHVKADDTAMPLSAIPGWLLAAHGLTVTPQQVRSWADRGILQALPETIGRGKIRKFPPRHVLAVARSREEDIDLSDVDPSALGIPAQREASE